MNTPQALRRTPSRETKASAGTKSAGSARDRRPSRSAAAGAPQQSPAGRSPRYSAASPRSVASRSTQASSARGSVAGHHHRQHHHRHQHHHQQQQQQVSQSQAPSHAASSTLAGRAPGSATRASRERPQRGASAARERTALCRYMERYGAMQPLRIALLQLYDQRPSKGPALVQMRASLGDNRPNMQEWQLMKRQVNDSVAQIASLRAEGERLRRRLEALHRGVLPSLSLGRSPYR